MHLNIDTWDIFLSAINWVDTVGHVCVDESWMLDQCQHFLETGICGYTSEETIKNMKTRFFANFHAIVCCSDDDASKMMTIYSHSSSVFQVYLVHSPPLKCILRHPPLGQAWLQQFRWDHWSSGLSLRSLHHSHYSRILRHYRD